MNIVFVHFQDLLQLNAKYRYSVCAVNWQAPYSGYFSAKGGHGLEANHENITHKSSKYSIYCD